MNQSPSRIKQLKAEFKRLGLDEKRQLLDDSLAQLRGHPPFEAFLIALDELRTAAIRNAIHHESVTSNGATFAALGEIRAYEDILDLIEEKVGVSP